MTAPAAIPENLKGDLEVYVTPDGQKAYIRNLFPYDKWGRPIGMEEIFRTLRSSGIRIGILKMELSESVQKVLGTNNPIQNVLAARVKDDSPVLCLGENKIPFNSRMAPGQFSEIFNAVSNIHQLPSCKTLKEVAFFPTHGVWISKGDVLAANLKQNGPGAVDVCGNKFESSNMSHPEFHPGRKVEFDPENNHFIALASGYLSVHSQTISLLPPFWVSPDKQRAYAVLLPCLHGSVRVSSSHIENFLDELCVVKSLRKAVENLEKSVEEGVETVLLAEGSPAQAGKDGFLRFLAGKNENESTPVIGGAVDYRSYHSVINVKQGDVIAEVIRAIPETPAKNILGVETSVNVVAEAEYTLGKNVEEHEDPEGAERVISREDGILTLEGNRISVEPALIISGDVDFSVGNIKSDSPVLIHGNVEQGFRVESAKSVLVYGHVNNGAYIRSGGAVRVEKGVFGKDTQIVADQALMVSFVQEATLISKGPMEVEKFSLNATLYSSDTATIRGRGIQNKGAVVGGLINGKNGIEAKSAGSVSSPLTQLISGVDIKAQEEVNILNERLNVLNHNMAKINRSIGIRLDNRDVAQVITKLPPARKKAVVEKLKEIKLNMSRQKLIKTKVDSIKKNRARDNRRARIHLQGELIPDVLIQIAEAKKQFTQPERNIEFFYADDTAEIAAIKKS